MGQSPAQDRWPAHLTTTVCWIDDPSTGLTFPLPATLLDFHCSTSPSNPYCNPWSSPSNTTLFSNQEPTVSPFYLWSKLLSVSNETEHTALLLLCFPSWIPYFLSTSPYIFPPLPTHSQLQIFLVLFHFHIGFSSPCGPTNILPFFVALPGLLCSLPCAIS